MKKGYDMCVYLNNCLESQYLGIKYFENTTNDLTSLYK